MSKNSLYVIVALALAATAASFFATGHDSKRVCFMNSITAGTQDVIDGSGAPETNTPTKATVRGYPLAYYEEPFPANCISSYSSASTGTFNTAHLAYDLLIWLAVAFLLFLPSTLYKWWRGPRMLGDKGARI